jgi:hypothetical protein
MAMSTRFSGWMRLTSRAEEKLTGVGHGGECSPRLPKSRRRCQPRSSIGPASAQRGGGGGPGGGRGDQTPRRLVWSREKVRGRERRQWRPCAAPPVAGRNDDAAT